MIDCSVVVLPAPLRPSSVTTSPPRTSKSTPCRTCDSPYQALRSRTRAAARPRRRARHGGAAATAVRHGPLPGRPARRPDSSTRRVVALGQDLAAREHGDVVGQRRDDRQVVLDHQHGAVRRDAADQRGDALDVLVRHAGGRLVEQHHLRIERERRRDLERALAAVGQLDRVRVARTPSGRRRRSARARARRARRACASERQKSNEWPRLRCSAMRTFSSTVRCGNTAEIWNERTSPMRAIVAGREPVISRPLKKIWPRVGVRKCVSRLKQVVLPAPFGPISAWIVPRRTREATRP